MVRDEEFKRQISDRSIANWTTAQEPRERGSFYLQGDGRVEGAKDEES
jgi:hypothetical protein